MTPTIELSPYDAAVACADAGEATCAVLAKRMVSNYETARDNVGKPLALVGILDGIQNGRWASQIADVRQASADGDEDKADTLKKGLPGFTAAGVFSPTRKKSSLAQASGLLVIDIDDLESLEKAEDIRDQLGADRHALAAFVSPGGRGVKAIFYIGTCADDEEAKSAWRALAEYLAKTYDLGVDVSGKDVCRLCFVSHDRWLVFNYNPIEPFTGRMDVPKPKTAPAPALTAKASHKASGAPDEAVVRSAVAMLNAGCSRADWLAIGCAIKNGLGDSGFQIFDSWSATAPEKYSAVETRKLWDSIQPEGGVTIGTLFHRAEVAGWINPHGRHANDALAALGERLTSGDEEEDVGDPFVPFPVDCFPGQVADYVRTVAASNCVDPCAPALAVLTVAGAAMGNAFRLKLKNRFTVPPLLWGCVVGRTGTNKTAPMKEVVEPLRETRPEVNHEDPTLARMALLCPKSRGVIGDATSAAVIYRLSQAPRGLLSFRDELAAWVKEFDAYKKGAGGGGGDEQFWLKAWDADHYQLDRKTDLEHKEIHAAAVSVLGGMQPSMLASCFDPAKFASGLVPRLLAVFPPEQSMRWTETEISDEVRASWKRIIEALRFHPFEAFGAVGASYEANVVELSPGAKESFVAFFDALSSEMEAMDDFKRMFASKARVMVARLALILHGMEMATARGIWSETVSRQTMDSAVTIGRWFLNEQFRVYGGATIHHDRKRTEEVTKWVRSHGGRTSARELQRAHNKRYRSAELAKLDLERLVEAGRGHWDGSVFVLEG